MRHTIRLLFAAALGLAFSLAAAQTYPTKLVGRRRAQAPQDVWQDQRVGDLLGAAEEHDIEPLIHEAAGQSVVWCKKISTVKAVVDRLVTEAKQALEKLRA